jgi:hypothetical protein
MEQKRRRVRMNEEPDAYQAYLLRLWRVRRQGRWQWRASLESPHTGERQAFGELAQLFAFLGERCEGRAPETRGGGEEETRRHGGTETR